MGFGLRSKAASKVDSASHLFWIALRSFHQWDLVGQVSQQKKIIKTISTDKTAFLTM